MVLKEVSDQAASLLHNLEMEQEQEVELYFEYCLLQDRLMHNCIDFSY